MNILRITAKKHDAWMDLASKFDTEKSVVEKKMRSFIGQFQREKRSLDRGQEQKKFLQNGLDSSCYKNKVRSTNDAGLSEVK